MLKLPRRPLDFNLFGRTRSKGRTPNKYRPHQGGAECERRRRRILAGKVPGAQILRRSGPGPRRTKPAGGKSHD